MTERLEMVVSGRRQTAMPTAPEFASRVSPAGGFLLEGHRHFSSFELPDHWIPFYMVGLQTTRGKVTRHFLANGRQHRETIENGSCFVVGPRELRRFRIEGTGSANLVSIEPGILEEVSTGSAPRSPQELLRFWNGDDPALKNLILRLQAEVAAGCPGGPILGESICIKLAEELIQRYSIGRTRLERFKGGLSGAQLRRTFDYIEESLDDRLDTNSIAGVAGLSKYHFGKAFLQSTGLSLHGYVLSRRIRRSQVLLTKSHLPLAAIAEAAGFSNQSHFTSVFSTRIGIPPGAYRQLTQRVAVRVHG